MKPMVCAAVLLAFIGAARAADLDWQRFQDTSVIEILTHDEGGALRETSVWIVPLVCCMKSKRLLTTPSGTRSK